MERLEATVLNTVFHNPNTGYSVINVHTAQEDTAVVGTLPEMNSGELAVFSGTWTEHPTYGRQFKCESFELRIPTTPGGIERYLASGQIRGIGLSTAMQIVARFGEETLTVLSEHPERLMELPGIGPKKCAMIAESFREQQGTRQAVIFLQSFGIPDTLAIRISDQYREKTREIIQRDPYQLCDDMEGIGFRTADRIAVATGFAPDGERRVQCALRYVLREAAAERGHLYLPESELNRTAAELLGVPASLCARNLKALLLNGDLIAESVTDDRAVYLASLWRAEEEVALLLRRLMCASLTEPVPGTSRAIRAFEKRHHIQFSASQRDAISRALANGVFVITGGPGTGKTTIINCILELLPRETEVALCAPTGRAAKRMTEATGTEAKTIHRLLEYGGAENVFSRDESDPLEAGCIIADEASMIDLMLMRSLLRAIRPGSRLILVGDADQLPSVGAGNVLRDILDSEEVPCARLTEFFRQSETSRITVNAHLINHGRMPQLNEKDTDFFFERKSSFGDAARSIVALVTRRLPAYLGYPEHEALALSARSIQVLSPTRKGDCGVNTLNRMLQAAMNPPDRSKPEMHWGESVFRLGDKVIQIRNNYQLGWVRRTGAGEENGSGVFNGDVGFVISVIPEGDELSVTVRFDDDRDAVYNPKDLGDLELAYCLSVHKSQGSEFPVIVMPVVGGPPLLMTRNLLYTALTRARRMVVLTGREEVIRSMVENDYVARRYTSLARRLKESAVYA